MCDKFDEAVSELVAGVEAHGGKEYKIASQHFKKAAELFKRLREEEMDEQLQTTAAGNFYQARANYHQSIADYLNFKMQDYESAANSYNNAVADKKNAIKIVKDLLKEGWIKDQKLPLELESDLYGLEAARFECLAQTAIMNKNLEKAADHFREACEAFKNKEKIEEDLKNPHEEKLARADKTKCEGLYHECLGIYYLEKGKKKQAKELLLKAKERYEEAVNLNPEFQVLSKALERVNHILLKL